MAAISLPAQIVRTSRFTLGVPGQFTVTPDGASVLFLRSRAGHDPLTCLWLLDLASGTERLLATGIAGYAADASANLAAFTLDGALWTVDVGTGQARRMPAQSPVTDPRPDPAGRRIAYLSRGALRVIEADGTADRAIATPDDPDDPDVAFGTADLTGTTSLTGSRGYWWAPDGARLLVARMDSTDVPRWHIAVVTLWIAALDGSRTQVRWDIDAFEYLPGAGWDAHGRYAVVQSRDQRTVRFLRIDQATSKTFILNEQWDHCWVQLIPGLPARSGDGAFIAHADRHGTRHLTVDGVPVTPPGLQLRAVLGVDGDEILFTASDDPAETHLWTYRPADGLRRLTSEPGVHHGTRRAGTLVHTARCAGQPGGRTTVVRPHQPPVPIGSRAERPVLDLHATPLVLGPRELRAVLYLPSWHRPGQGSLPVLANQVTAVREAARLHPELDLGRVGIRGWSFGGSLAALAVLRRPDVFPASTLRLSSALLAAGRPHEVLLLAGVGHHAMGTPVTEHLLQHQVRFLQRHLGAVPGDL
jgi:dipeptidyl-peptidase-4